MLKIPDITFTQFQDTDQRDIHEASTGYDEAVTAGLKINISSSHPVTIQPGALGDHKIRKLDDVKPLTTFGEQQSCTPEQLSNARKETLPATSLSPETSHTIDSELSPLMEKLESLLNYTPQNQDERFNPGACRTQSHLTTENDKALDDKKGSVICKENTNQPDVIVYTDAANALKPFCKNNKNLIQHDCSDNTTKKQSTHFLIKKKIEKLMTLILKTEEDANKSLFIEHNSPIHKNITISSELSKLRHHNIIEYKEFIKEISEKELSRISAIERLELLFKIYAALYFKLFHFLENPDKSEEMHNSNINIILFNHLRSLTDTLPLITEEITSNMNTQEAASLKELALNLVDEIDNEYIALCASPLLADILYNRRACTEKSYKMLLKSLSMWLHIANDMIINRKSYCYEANLIIIGELCRLSRYCTDSNYCPDSSSIIRLEIKKSLLTYIIKLTATNFSSFSEEHSIITAKIIDKTPSLSTKIGSFEEINDYVFLASKNLNILRFIKEQSVIPHTINMSNEYDLLQTLNLLISTAEHSLIFYFRSPFKNNPNTSYANICTNLVFELINQTSKFTERYIKHNTRIIFRLIDLSGMYSYYLEQKDTSPLFKKLQLLINDGNSLQIKNISEIAFTRILESDSIAKKPEFSDCTRNSLIRSALAGDHYSRVHCFLGLINHKSCLKFKLLPDKVSMLDMAMRLITYNASMEKPDYGYLLSIQNRSEISRSIAEDKLQHLKIQKKTADIILMNALWQYETSYQHQQLSSKKNKRERETKDNQFCNAVAIYLTQGHENTLEYLDNIEFSPKTSWLKGWIYQQLERYDEALKQFSFIDGNTADINKAECQLAILGINDNNYPQVSLSGENIQLFHQAIEQLNNTIALYKKHLPTFDKEVARLEKIFSVAISRLEDTRAFSTDDASSVASNFPSPIPDDKKTSEKHETNRKKPISRGRKKTSPVYKRNTKSKAKPDKHQFSQHPKYNLPKQYEDKTRLTTTEISSITSTLNNETSRKTGDMVSSSTPNLWEQLEGKLKLIIRKYICADHESKATQQESDFNTIIKKSGKTCPNTDKHLYQNFNTLIRSIIHILNRSNGIQEDHESLETKVNIITNTLLARNNAFFVGQNLLFDHLGWLLINNIELFINSDQLNKSSQRIVYNYAFRLFLISTCNSIELDINIRDTANITPAYITSITTAVKEYLNDFPIQDAGEDTDYNARYQFKSRIICRITNLYHALKILYPDDLGMRKPLMDLRNEIIPTEIKFDKEARKTDRSLVAYLPLLTMVDSLSS